MALVSLVDAKAQCGVSQDDHDHDLFIQQKADHATDLVLARCNGTAYWRLITPTWTESTVPGEVKAAILLVLTFLWAHRGDGEMPDGKFWDSIGYVIGSKKDPVIA